MRVIAGSARHLKLKTIEGMGTRPTTDRIKETLFNMLSFYVEDSRFLDLFSGSGGIGIEALSRGAKQAVFVEQNKKAVACIKENLTHTHLNDKAVVMSKDVMTALRILEDFSKVNLLDLEIQKEQTKEKEHDKELAQEEVKRQTTYTGR